MAKIKDFLKNVAEKGGIKNSDFEMVLAASTLDPIEIPDAFVTAFDQSYMTKDRAMNDPSIVQELTKKSNKMAFDTFDKKIEDFFQFIDAEEIDKIKATPESYQKYDILKFGLNKAKKNAGTKVNEDANKILEEKNTEIKQLKDKFELEKKQFQDALNNQVIDGIITTKILAHNFADAFKPMKDTVAKMKLAEMRQKYTLVNDKGAVKLMQAAPDGSQLIEVYDGNEKLTIEKFLEKDLKDFIAVNSGTTEKDKQQKVEIPNPGDLSKMTLAEIRAKSANGVHTLPN